MSIEYKNVENNRDHPCIETAGDTVTGDLFAGTSSDPLSAVNKEYVDANIDNKVPIGFIVMYQGTTAALPAGWVVCDGGNGTPNLRDIFVRGTAITAKYKTTGGSNNAIMVSHNHTMNHNHSVSCNSTGGHSHTTKLYSDDWMTTGGSSGSMDDDTSGGWSSTYNSDYEADHDHSDKVSNSTTVTTSTKGSSGTNKNMPQYYELIYIQKIA